MSKIKLNKVVVEVSKVETVKDGIVIDNPDMRFTGYRRVVESYIKVA